MRNLSKFLNLTIHHRNQTKFHVSVVIVQTFFIKSNYYHCSNCFVSLADVLGYYDKAEYERFYFRKKSIYQKKYLYQNKIKQAINKFNLVLSEDEQYQLHKKLMDIIDEKLSKLNKKFKRKRLIKIYYIIMVARLDFLWGDTSQV